MSREGPAVERIIRGTRVATPGGIHPAAIHIAGGRIMAVRPFDDIPPSPALVEADDAVVFPGLVETHAHVNEPGRAEWEGFATATRAAAAGGITTLIDMPLNSIPPTTSFAALEMKRRSARNLCAVDVGFLGGLVPNGRSQIETLHEAGVFGLKCFLCPSGVEEFPPITLDDLRAAGPALASNDILLMVHAELPSELAGVPGGDPQHYATWLATRPVSAETEAVRALIEVAREFAIRIHVVHVSAPETVELIARARAQGVRLTAETCPHYLTFASEEIPDRATEYKCAPPIRESIRREGLWLALERGQLDAVVSDHSPAPPELKGLDQGDFLGAWGGIASLQLRLPAVWTLARARGHQPERLLSWLCEGPARLVGLGGIKGTIAAGADADLVIWRPEEEFQVEADMLRHRHPICPWTGRRLAGVVLATYLGGELIYAPGMPDEPPRGRLLVADSVSH
jgi:allantoinase